jgi:hypothetical protein
MKTGASRGPGVFFAVVLSMVVLVLYRHGQPLSQLLVRPSLTGHTLLGRVRSTTIAMLGIPAAIGLCLMALVLNQGWPSVFGGAMPVVQSEPSRHGGAPAPFSPDDGGEAAASRPSAIVSTPAGGGQGAPASSNLSGSRQAAAPSPASPNPAAEHPSQGAPSTPPAQEPVTTSPPASPGSAPSSKAGSSAKGKGGGKGASAKSKSVSKGRTSKKGGRSSGASKPPSPKPSPATTPAKQSTPAPVVEPAKGEAAKEASSAEADKKKNGSGGGNAYGHEK